jgi:hypothetical protein
MKLDHQLMQSIHEALSDKYVEVPAMLDVKLAQDIEEKAKLIYSRYNEDKRSYEEVYVDVLIGELGEHAIVQLIQQANIDAVHNEEQTTGQYYWDILVANEAGCLFGEIKFQGGGFAEEPKTTFAFTTKKKDQLMRDSWMKLDFIIAFYLKQQGNKLFVVPWLILDNEAISPLRGLYQVSLYNEGYYLQMHKAQVAGLFKHLNKDANLFTFA